MEVQIAVAKINRLFSNDGGDTVEVVERPNGGGSIVLVEGKFDSANSKAISLKVVHRVIGLISEGIHDGSAAKAVGRNLFTENAGHATAALNILSCDFLSDTIVITRANPLPVCVVENGILNCLKADSDFIGKSDEVHSTVYQLPLEGSKSVIMFTDGIANAGKSFGSPIDICVIINALFQEQEPTAQDVADFILSQAISLDQNQPLDDMSVVVMQINAQTTGRIRRLSVQFPIK